MCREVRQLRLSEIASVLAALREVGGRSPDLDLDLDPGQSEGEGPAVIFWCYSLYQTLRFLGLDHTNDHLGKI